MEDGRIPSLFSFHGGILGVLVVSLSRLSGEGSGRQVETPPSTVVSSPVVSGGSPSCCRRPDGEGPNGREPTESSGTHYEDGPCELDVTRVPSA